MVRMDETICPDCGGGLKYYDSVKRIIRTRGRNTKKIVIRRLRCPKCRKIHRELPNDILPYKQYETEIIQGVLDGFITTETFGYEDYPCEMTMIRWIAQKASLLHEIHLLCFNKK